MHVIRLCFCGPPVGTCEKQMHCTGSTVQCLGFELLFLPPGQRPQHDGRQSPEDTGGHGTLRTGRVVAAADQPEMALRLDENPRHHLRRDSRSLGRVGWPGQQAPAPAPGRLGEKCEGGITGLGSAVLGIAGQRQAVFWARSEVSKDNGDGDPHRIPDTTSPEAKRRDCKTRLPSAILIISGAHLKRTLLQFSGHVQLREPHTRKPTARAPLKMARQSS